MQAACLEVIAAADEVIEKKNQEIDLQKQLLSEKDRQIQDLEASKVDPLKSGLTGALLGIILYSALKR